MSLEVRADFLFGWYQGHSRAGELEDVPSLERLHAALLAGACSLERQEGKHPDEGIDSLDKDLLRGLRLILLTQFCCRRQCLSSPELLRFATKVVSKRELMPRKRNALLQPVRFSTVPSAGIGTLCPPMLSCDAWVILRMKSPIWANRKAA